MTRQELLKLHSQIMSECQEIMKAKNHDYSSEGDPFENFRAASVLGLQPELGLLIRVIDKIQRLKTYIKEGKLLVKNEGFDDAIKDVINYMVLLAGMLKEKDAK